MVNYCSYAFASNYKILHITYSLVSMHSTITVQCNSVLPEAIHIETLNVEKKQCAAQWTQLRPLHRQPSTCVSLSVIVFTIKRHEAMKSADQNLVTMLWHKCTLHTGSATETQQSVGAHGDLT